MSYYSNIDGLSEQLYKQYQDSNEITETRMLFDRRVFLKDSELASLNKFVNMYHEIYRLISDDLTQQEINQVNQSRKQIAEGKSKKFGSVEEYLKSLDTDER